MTKNEELLKSIRVQISNIADDLDHMRSKLEDLTEALDSITDDIDDMIDDIDDMIEDDDAEDDCEGCKIFTEEEMEAVVKASVQFIKDILDQIGDHD